MAWYDSVVLYRQDKKADGWKAVVQRVKRDLKQRMKKVA